MVRELTGEVTELKILGNFMHETTAILKSKKTQKLLGI